MKITTRALGRRKPLMDDFGVPPPTDVGDGGELRLRDLIEHVVRHEVQQFQERQRALRYDRVLTAAEIKSAIPRGKIDPAGKDFDQRVVADEAVQNALLAFSDGLYLVLIDDVEQRDLDTSVYITPESTLVFLRLVFLAGA